MTTLRSALAALALAAVVALPSLAALPAAPAHASPGASTSAEGPHSPVGRRPAALSITKRSGVAIREVDLGDVDLGRAANPRAFRGPVRGVIVTPDRPAAHAPLIVLSHLRMPGCSDDATTYPCPKGATEVRYDRGMTYLGEALAKQGYAVLIPDLAPLWGGGLLNYDYDQISGWTKTVDPLRDELMAASAGKRTRLGAGLVGAVDGRRTGLLVHSRSAQIVASAMRSWKGSSTPIRSVIAYGGSYSTPDENGRFTAPIPADVPFLGIQGDADNDVNRSGSEWLTEQVEQKRSAPALEVVLPGFGHSYVNRALSAAKRDDRIDVTVPTAADHEKMLTTVAASWFDQTLRGKGRPYPTSASAALPARLAGYPARWLAVTNAPHGAFTAGASAAPRAIGGGRVRTCRYYLAMDPTPYKDRCSSDIDGAVVSMSKVAQVRLSAGGGARFTVAKKGATTLALQVAPTGSRADKVGGTPLRVVVHTSSGRAWTTDVAASHPALQDRKTAEVNGEYVTSTIRLALPDWMRGTTVTSVDLLGAKAGGALDVRAIDVADVPRSDSKGGGMRLVKIGIDEQNGRGRASRGA